VSIQNFERNTVNYGADNFDWTSPIDEQAYTVRFGKPVEYNLEDNSNTEWNVTIELIEANPVSS
jgi:hypothetical protein